MDEQNTLFPIFLKLQSFKTLIVGGGHVGHEKLSALLKNDPDAVITLIAQKIDQRILSLAALHKNVKVIEREFTPKDLLTDISLLILATDDHDFNQEVRHTAKKLRILTNVADTPDLCDFYLGSTVSKGNLKIGISTNGKSPTFAKRFRQLLEEILPNETDELIRNLNAIRNDLKGNFSEKVKILNEHTKSLIS